MNAIAGVLSGWILGYGGCILRRGHISPPPLAFPKCTQVATILSPIVSMGDLIATTHGSCSKKPV